MTNPQVAIDIVGNNLTDKGASAAEKRLGKLGDRATKIGKDVGKVGDRGFGSILRTFSEVDRAASDAFGNRSAFAGIGRQMGAFAKIGSSFRSGLGRTAMSLGRISTVGEGAASELGATAAAGEAAEAGMSGAAEAAGGLATAFGGVAAVGAGAVAVVGAMAVAAYKLGSDWADGTARIGRFAETIGVATKNLQELQGAAERFGIGKDATNSAVSSFAQTVHDARYGRNQEALALMMRLGVKFRTGADGNLDYSAMLADTSDALARQKDPQTALMIANRLGIAGMLPLLRKGSANLRSETADVDKHGVMVSDDDVSAAEKFVHDRTQISQMAERAWSKTRGAIAKRDLPALGAGVRFGQEATDGTLGRRIVSVISEGADRFDRAVKDLFSPGASKIDQAANKMLNATSTSERVAAGDLATRIEKLGERSKQWQVSNKGAVGVMQVMPGTARTQARRMGIPFDEHRYKTDTDYNRMIGQSYLRWLQNRFGGDEVLATAAYNAGEGAVDGWIKRFGDPRKGQISDDEFARKIPYRETRDYVGRVIYGESPAQQHIHRHEINVHDKRVTVRTTTDGSSSLAVSHAPVGR